MQKIISLEIFKSFNIYIEKKTTYEKDFKLKILVLYIKSGKLTKL